MANQIVNSHISFYRKVSGIASTDTMPFDIFLENIRSGKWEDIVTKIRIIKDKKKRDEEKSKTCPSVTVSGTFEPERTDINLKKHSGFIGIDIDQDGLPKDTTAEKLKDILSKDSYVVSAFISVSGLGLCIIFRVNPDKHREAFQGICEYLYKNYKAIADPTSINVSRPRFVSFDPNIYIRDAQAQKFTQYPKAKPPKKVEKVIYAESDFHHVMEQIISKRLNLVENYHDWLRVGFAFAHKFGEQGREYFHLVSQFSAKYDSDVCDKQYNACLKHTSNKEATIATFYYYAKQAGLEIYSSETRKIAYSAAHGKKSGLKPEQVAENLSKFEEIETTEEVKDIIKQVFDNNININEDTLLDQIELWIRQNYSLRFNEITHFIENNGKPLKKRDLNSIFIQAKKLFEKCNFELIDRLIDSNFIPTYNPFHEFFAEHAPGMYVGKATNSIAPDAFLGGIPNLKDGPYLPPYEVVKLLKTHAPNVTQLFQTITTDDPDYTLYFGAKWLVGIISSIYGDPSPLYFALLGGQNIGKTEFYRRLLPLQLKAYYAESKLDEGKDDKILMTKKLIIMDDEMGGKTRKEYKQLNDLTSKDVFTLREPYGRFNVDLKRLATLCGNSNDLGVLHDPFGNRRIIPIHVKAIDHDVFNSIDKVELWVEVFYLYHAGLRWPLKQTDIEYLNKEGTQFEALVAEGELILKYFEPGENDQLTSTEVKVFIEQKTNQRLNLDQIGKQMKKLGFQQKHIRINNSTKRVWMVNHLSPIAAGTAPKHDDDDLPF